MSNIRYLRTGCGATATLWYNGQMRYFILLMVMFSGCTKSMVNDWQCDQYCETAGFEKHYPEKRGCFCSKKR